jgi:Zn-dependent protease
LIEQVAGYGEPCRSCGTVVATSLRACPSCGRLVHADALKHLATQAEAAEQEVRLSEALRLWREALDLLPSAARQHATILTKVQALSARLGEGGESASPKARSSGAAGKLGALGVGALLVWKFKAVILLVLSKLKLVVLGLGKAKTLFTMLLSFSLYWNIWGWPFAAGFVLAIYVHEMGHVWALRRYGIAASAPMFIPGLGAFVRLKQYPASVRENADVGLAGPLWGMAAAAAAALLFVITDAGIFGAIAHTAAWLNIFNLLPVFGLDGAHGFSALSRKSRGLVAALFGLAFLVSHDGLVALVALVMVWKAFDKTSPAESDRATVIRFAVLAAGLTALLFVRGAPA